MAQEIQVLKIWNQKCLYLKGHKYSTAYPKWTGVDLVAILWKHFSQFKNFFMKNAYMLDFEVNLQKKIHYGTLCISTYCKKLV